MSNSFIQKLNKARSNYANASQACTQAKSLELLSSGIYTEEERFIFELLQNAVDAYNGSKVLNVKIVLCDNYLVFMHNGNEFTPRDVEGLCDVGYGNKMTDVQKIGYKGIGFKSVFMHSKLVTVQSGDFCFKFEKQAWDNYWNLDWGAKDPNRAYSMPWQIIPIETTAPISIETKGFNVVTYISTNRASSLKEKIEKLFSSCSFLLFLRHANINIDFLVSHQLVTNLRKETLNNIVTLYINNKVNSRWLVYCNNDITISEDVHQIIANDGITPLKLQEAKTYDISFAIPLNDKGEIFGLTDSIVYTYLPTSITFGFPFLVNANFITDAGRQHLVHDSEWNKMIVKQIPFEFLQWMSTISISYRHYYQVLPRQIQGEEKLNQYFNQSLEEAIDSIAFIPSKFTGLLKAKESLMDRLGISSVISCENLVHHINKKFEKDFSQNSFIYNGGISILKEYGVFAFDAEKLATLFEDEDIFIGIDVNKDAELVTFLYSYYAKNDKNGSEFVQILSEVKFLYADDDTLDCPKNMYFPSNYRVENSLAYGAKVLHNELYSLLSGNRGLIDWLGFIGVSEMNDTNIIKKLICKDGFVTKENAIDVGRYLFDVWKNKDIRSKLSNSDFIDLKFLTNKGGLKRVSELYQSSKYFPVLDIEDACDIDMFVSDEYCQSDTESTKREWHNFFRDFGIIDSIHLKELQFRRDSEVYDLLQSYVSFAESHEYNHSSWTGEDYYMSFSYINIEYVPFVSVMNTPLRLSKLVWTSILQKPLSQNRKTDYIYGSTGWNYYKRGYLCDNSPEHKYLGENFLSWVIKHYQTFPASNGEMLRISDIYRRTPLTEELFGTYLPYLDVDCEIDKSWDSLLKFKTEIELDDYLMLLSNISEDLENAESNKSRISKIYQRIVENFDIKSDSCTHQIKGWAAKNTILSQEGLFMHPSDLRYVTVDGFGKKNRAHIGTVSNRDKVIELLDAMGVKILTEKSINTKFENNTEEDDIKKCLINKIKVLAVLKAGEKPTEEEFKNELGLMAQHLKDTHFYHCTEIKLTCGENDVEIKKATFAQSSNFYYTGELRISKIDPILTPLCSYLKLENKERELMVTMFEDMDSIREYLAGKEYDVSFLKDVTVEPSQTFVPTLNYERTEDQKHRDVITGHKGEILVYEKLRELGYTPVCYCLSDENDYEDKVEFMGKTYYCKRNIGRYDISFTLNTGKEMLVEVKTTTMSKESQSNMPISYREISLVEEYNNDENRSYVIVRVFNIESSNPDIYLFKGHTL